MEDPVDSRSNAATNGEGELSPLEQEVLDEYAKLVGNLDNVRNPPSTDLSNAELNDTDDKCSSQAFWPSSRQGLQPRY